ncbi:MAG: OmpA family protein [Bacteroidales bacterium]|jgi:chemotaxis protein MotB|nr:OmpA family protein [Bacteroidales bacterium]
MKKIFFVFLGTSILFASCVTKQKYTECTTDLSNCEEARKELSAQKLDLDNKITEFEVQRGKMQAQIRQLESDTTHLGRLSREMSSNYTSLQANYDDLTAAYKTMSAGNKKEAEAMLGQLQEAQRKLDEKEKEIKSLMTDLDKKSSDLEEKNTKLIELQNILSKKDADVQALKNKIKSALVGFEGSGLQVTEKNGKVYVSMDEKLLFASGKFSVDAKGEAALKELSKILEADKDINVMVEGHTDNVPFSAASAAQIRDNWDLSVMRATTIVKTILKYGDIDPNRLTASGRGEYVPLDTADTKEARAKNRRTEIILTPKLDALFEILE